MLGAYVSLTIGRAAGKAEGMEGGDTKMCGCQRGWQGREERIKGCRRRKDVEGPRSFCHPSFSSAPRYGRFTQLSPPQAPRGRRPVFGASAQPHTPAFSPLPEHCNYNIYSPFDTSGYTSKRRCVVTGIPARASSITFGSVSSPTLVSHIV